MTASHYYLLEFQAHSKLRHNILVLASSSNVAVPQDESQSNENIAVRNSGNDFSQNVIFQATRTGKFR